MDRDFEGAEVIGQRTEEAIIQELEQNLRAEADQRGLEPVEENAAGIELLEESIPVESEEELEEYLNGLQGLRTADVVLRAGRSDRRPNTLAEEVSLNLDFDNQGFLDIYVQADVELGVENAGFSFVGYGDNAVEAYENSAPMIAFNLADHGGFTASYRDGTTVIEAFWSEDSDEVKTVYDALQSADAQYNGAVLEGDQEPEEWMIADYGSKEVQEMR